MFCINFQKRSVEYTSFVRMFFCETRLYMPLNIHIKANVNRMCMHGLTTMLWMIIVTCPADQLTEKDSTCCGFTIISIELNWTRFFNASLIRCFVGYIYIQNFFSRIAVTVILLIYWFRVYINLKYNIRRVCISGMANVKNDIELKVLSASGAIFQEHLNKLKKTDKTGKTYLNRPSLDDLKVIIETLTKRKEEEVSVLSLLCNQFENSSKLFYGLSKPTDNDSTGFDRKLVGKLFNSLTNHPLPSFLDYKTDENPEFTIKDLFFLAVIDYQMVLAEELWQYLDSDFIASALVAGTALRAIAEKMESEQSMFNLSQEMLESAKMFETKAANILHESFKANLKIANLLLVRELDGWGDQTVLSLAYAGQHMNFMANDCCQRKLNEAWCGKIPPYTPGWKIAIGSILPPVITFSNTFATHNVEKHKSGKMLPFVFCYKFYNNPVIKFCTHSISYLIFLTAFSMFLLTELPSDRYYLEIVVMVWVCSIYIDELRQLFISCKKAHPCNPFKKDYFNSWWNCCDQLQFWLAVLAVILKAFKAVDRASEAFAVVFVIYVFRILQYFYVVEVLGPKIEIIHRMIKDLLFFLLMFSFFILAFGIPFQALVHPNDQPVEEFVSSNRTFDVARHVFYFPLFSHLPTIRRFERADRKLSKQLWSHNRFSTRQCQMLETSHGSLFGVHAHSFFVAC